MKEIIMLSIFLCAVISDLQDYKIRNPVIIAGWTAGILINFITYGIYGALHAVFCIIVTIITGLPLFMLGGTGAGDIKLLSVIGGIYGLAFLCKVTLLLLFMAGAVSLVKLVKERALVTRVKAFIYYLMHVKTACGRYYQTGRDGKESVICLAPLMAASYVIVLFLQILQGKEGG